MKSVTSEVLQRAIFLLTIGIVLIGQDCRAESITAYFDDSKTGLPPAPNPRMIDFLKRVSFRLNAAWEKAVAPELNTVYVDFSPSGYKVRSTNGLPVEPRTVRFIEQAVGLEHAPIAGLVQFGFHPWGVFKNEAQANASLDNYFDLLEFKVKSNWVPRRKPSGRELQAVAMFRITKKGVDADFIIDAPSGDEAFDNSAALAIEKSFPLSGLPVEAPIDVEYVFNLKRRLANSPREVYGTEAQLPGLVSFSAPTPVVAKKASMR